MSDAGFDAEAGGFGSGAEEKQKPRRWGWWWRALLGVAVIVLVAVVGVLTAVYSVMQGSLPVTAGRVVVPGMERPVTIRFDAQQRAYVTAETLEDALRAEGWLHASHRLWQMEMFRRAGKGRLAELLGASLLETDQELYRIGVPQLAKKLEENATPELSFRVEAYVAGVNAGIGRLSARPVEFWLVGSQVEPWTAADVYALGAVMAYQSANNMENELLRLALRESLSAEQFAIFLTDSSERGDFPFVLESLREGNAEDRGDDGAGEAVEGEGRVEGALETLRRLAAIDPAEGGLVPRLGFGSNGWVVAAEKSKSGKALFAFDSHDALGLPNLFYEVHLFFGEGKSIRGWSVAGLPGVVNGYNERIAWGFTNIGDTQDLFLETRSEDDPLQFLDGEEWYTAETETYAIPVSGRETAAEFEVVFTRNGPLVSEDPPIALRWTAHAIGERGLQSFLEMNLAEDWESFNRAVDGIAAPTLNATYADVEGTIGFRTVGLLPVRGAGEGLYPLAGDVAENRWQGMVPTEAMPRRTNPEAGFLAAANARVNAAGDGPLVSADNAAPYRIRRIREVLSAEGKVGLAEMQELQMDWHDNQAATVGGAMLEAMEGVELSPRAEQARALIEGWLENPVAERSSAAAVVFQAWYLSVAEEVFLEPLGDEVFVRLEKRNYVLNHALDALILYEDDAMWWREGKGVMIGRALDETVWAFENRVFPAEGGMESWRLDRRQTVRLEHELAKAEPALAPLFNMDPAAWGGGPAMVGRANYRYDRPFSVSHGATLRVVAEMEPGGAVRAVMCGGQSGHPLSSFYADQFESWLAGALLPVAATATEMEGEVLELVGE